MSFSLLSSKQKLPVEAAPDRVLPLQDSCPRTCRARDTDGAKQVDAEPKGDEGRRMKEGSRVVLYQTPAARTHIRPGSARKQARGWLAKEEQVGSSWLHLRAGEQLQKRARVTGRCTAATHHACVLALPVPWPLLELIAFRHWVSVPNARFFRLQSPHLTVASFTCLAKALCCCGYCGLSGSSHTWGSCRSILTLFSSRSLLCGCVCVRAHVLWDCDCIFRGALSVSILCGLSWGPVLQSGFCFVLGRFCIVFVAQGKFLSYMSQFLQVSEKKD